MTDLAVQTGMLPIEKFESCHEDVLTWSNTEVSAAITYMKNRLWRSRARATAKQVEYGHRLLEELSEHTGTEVEDIDFEAMNSLEATEQITRLEALRDLFSLLDAEMPHIQDEMSTTTASAPSNLDALFRLVGQNEN